MRVLTITIAALALAAEPAAADHVAGATYRGTVTGGSPIELTLSADGRRVASYIAREVHGDTCIFHAEGDASQWPGAAIAEERFEYRLYDAILLRGSFPSRLTATGTLRLYNHATDVKPACDTGTLRWTATTTPTGDPPGGDGGASPPPPTVTPQTVAPKRTVATRVTLRRSRTRLSGKLAVADRSCRASRVVTLMRGIKRLGTARTKADGSFSFRRTASTRGRSVRAVVTSRSGAAAICGSGASKPIKG